MKFALKTIKKGSEDVGMNSLAYIENEVKILKSIEHVIISRILCSFLLIKFSIIAENHCRGGKCF